MQKRNQLKYSGYQANTNVIPNSLNDNTNQSFVQWNQTANLFDITTTQVSHDSQPQTALNHANSSTTMDVQNNPLIQYDLNSFHIETGINSQGSQNQNNTQINTTTNFSNPFILNPPNKSQSQSNLNISSTNNITPNNNLTTQTNNNSFNNLAATDDPLQSQTIQKNTNFYSTSGVPNNTLSESHTNPYETGTIGIITTNIDLIGRQNNDQRNLSISDSNSLFTQNILNPTNNPQSNSNISSTNDISSNYNLTT
jgi:hypothetical protein